MIAGVSVSYNLVNVGDVDLNGTSIPGSDANGSSVLTRIAIGYTFR